MALIDESLSLLRDVKHLVGFSRLGRSRARLFHAYLIVRWKALRNLSEDRATILGYEVGFLDSAEFLKLFREIFVHRYYQIRLESDAPTIIDCGSNIGMSVLFFKIAHPTATVIGFEPSPQAFPVLQQNIVRNALTNVTVHQKALGDHRGSVDFFYDPNRLGALNMGVVPWRHGSSIKVESDLLSSYLTGEVDLLKLDIEGAEESVLRDLASQGQLRLIRTIVCEYHHHLPAGTDRLAATLELLEDHGFGYNLHAYCERPSTGHGSHQDIMIYAYREPA